MKLCIANAYVELEVKSTEQGRQKVEATITTEAGGVYRLKGKLRIVEHKAELEQVEV